MTRAVFRSDAEKFLGEVDNEDTNVAGNFGLNFRKLVSRISRYPAFRGLAQRIRLWRKPFRLYLAEPENGELTAAICTIEGWFACADERRAMSLGINGLGLKYIPVDWPAVKLLFGDEHCQGFRAIVDVRQILTPHTEAHQMLKLELLIGKTAVASTPLRVSTEAVSEAKVAEAGRRRKREWLKTHVACPFCPPGEGQLDFAHNSISCRVCGEIFSDDGSALNFLPDDLKRQFSIDEVQDFSAHEYDDVAARLIEDVRSKNGKVLDCGSGLRSAVDETVICLDVVAFPAVDILGVNQRLPFQNGVFDALLSLNVLEHVSDPFLCASELVRVLKPGGTLYCCMPFLQPEHGYPHHYFNATRSGLKQLFPRDLELIEHFVPRSGEPMWTLHWFLSWYARQLPPEEQHNFLNMRFQDVIEKAPDTLLEESWVKRLSSEGKWQLASTTAAVFRKSRS